MGSRHPHEGVSAEQLRVRSTCTTEGAGSAANQPACQPASKWAIKQARVSERKCDLKNALIRRIDDIMTNLEHELTLIRPFALVRCAARLFLHGEFLREKKFCSVLTCAGVWVWQPGFVS